MKKCYLILPFFLFIISCTNKQGRIQVNFNENWLFSRQDINVFANKDYDDGAWRLLNLPHDWAIEDSVSQNNLSGESHGYFTGGVAWYRKHFLNEWKYKRVFLLFDGVFMNSDVYLNGKHIGFNSYGYIPFYYEITDALENENILSVRVDNSAVPVDRWYPGCGIYRNVWIIAVEDVHIPIWGTYVTTPVITDTTASISILAKLKNDGTAERDCKLKSSIVDANGNILASAETDVKIKAHELSEIAQAIAINKPIRWTLENPYLYKVVSHVFANGVETDKYETPFGIREIKFSADSGFILNGKKVLLKGVCIHHDLGCFGAAFNARAMERRLEILKSIGVNAIRLSHNPHAPELLDMCDKMGLLVFDEMYDEWEVKFGGYKGNMAPFMDTWKKDLTSFIDRDKNHPSVFIWSMGNEVREQSKNPARGDSIMKMLRSFVHNYEPTRKVTCAMMPVKEDPSRIIHSCDIVSYNYKTHDFDDWHKDYPGYIFLSSETKPCREQKLDDYSKYDFLTNSWFDMHEYICGQFIWTGIDYYGESKGWPERGNKSGLINTCGFRKPHSYFTESLYSDKPMVAMTVHDDSIANMLNTFNHWMLPWMEAPMSRHWNWANKKEKMVVYIFSNCEKIKLTLNGKDLGTKKPSEFKDQVARFDVQWEEGVIVATGMKGEKEICSDTLRTAGSPAKIQMMSDRSTINADGVDISNIEVRIVDDKGITCPKAKNVIQFEVSGPAFIVGVDNGDMADHFDLKGNKVEARGGRCLLVVQSKKDKGEITVRAKGAGLPESGITLKTK